MIKYLTLDVISLNRFDMQNLLTVFDVVGFVIPGFLVLGIFEIITDYNFMLSPDQLTLVPLAIYSGIAYVIGQVIDTVSQYIIEDLIVKNGIGHPAFYLLKKQFANHVFLREYRRPMPENIRRDILKQAKKDNLLESDDIDKIVLEKKYAHDFFDELTHLAVRLFQKNLSLFLIREFFVKYNFARNCGFALLITSLMGLGASRLNPSQINFVVFYVSLSSASILFFRFLKFYKLYVYEIMIDYVSYSQDKKVGF